MKILNAAPGFVSSIQPEYAGNIVTDGFTHYYYSQTLMTCLLTPDLFLELKRLIELIEVGQSSVLEVGKGPLSITDLLALNTTFNTEEIIKLKESDLV